MASIKGFEDINFRKKARILTKGIYQITSHGKFLNDFDLNRPIRRARISIMANIAEGFGGFSDKEFANFLNIALASARKVQSHLYIALDLKYIDQKTFENLYLHLNEIAWLINAFAKHLRK